MTNLPRRGWKRWLAVFGALSIIAAVAATQLTIRTGDLSLGNWAGLFLVQVIIWNIWGALTPIIFNLSAWLSRTKSKATAILVHVPVSLVMVLLFLALYTLIFLFFSGNDFTQFVAVLLGLITSALHWYLILYWITVGVEYFLRIQDRFKTQELLNLQLEGQLTEAQLKALKMQLNPHFLFNSLNTISGMVRAQETKKAVAMLARLSDFLREVLIDRGSQQITVSSEVGFLKKYLEIEQLRFGNKLSVDFNIDDEAQECMVPSLILQPIVENAIKHGISKARNAENILITINRRETHVAISIYNDGPNIQEIEKGELQHLGVGISNSIKRLQQLYGEDYEFDLNNKDDGVEVNLRIPLAT